MYQIHAAVILLDLTLRDYTNTLWTKCSDCMESDDKNKINSEYFMVVIYRTEISSVII